MFPSATSPAEMLSVIQPTMQQDQYHGTKQDVCINACKTTINATEANKLQTMVSDTGLI